MEETKELLRGNKRVNGNERVNVRGSTVCKE